MLGKDKGTGKDPGLDVLEKHDRNQELADTLEERFKRMFEGHEVPGNIRRAACLAMYRFTIDGICDGMYICNTIANESGCGDGQGNFTEPAKIDAWESARATGHTVPCHVCGKPVKVNYNTTTAKMQRKAAAVRCSACRQNDIEEAAEARKLRENERKAAEMKAEEAKFLMENGLCIICTTSYTKCERMQTGFRVLPKEVQYRDSKVVCCPKFKEKLKYCSPEQFTGAGAAESKAEGSIKTAG